MTASSSPSAFWGAHEASIAEWMEKIEKQSLVKRLWDKDASLWKKTPAAHKDIKARLGWLSAPAAIKKSLSEITEFAAAVKAEGVRHVVLMGMGGSSLAPEVFQKIFGYAEGHPALIVLDGTDPAKVKSVEDRIDMAKTLFIVSSKSGGTIELLSFFKYFFHKATQIKGDKAGENFIAITDPGTPLADMAKRHGFRRLFLAPEDVGGRFSALTFFGLVPAALVGVDVEGIAKSAEAMATASSGEGAANSAALLGVAMAVLAEEGRDKLTLTASSSLESFGDWVEQLVAESTGKEGSGIVPVVHETLGAPAVYGEDRFFVSLELESDKNAALAKKLDALEKAGHPVLRLRWKDRLDLGGEFFRWEAATAIACALLKVNAFDQPDVQAAKDKTKAILKSMETSGELSVKQSEITLESFWENAEAGDYVAILAFLNDSEAMKKKLLKLQSEVRDRTKLAATVGFGPRYLHSTGQLHKGGPRNGIFLLITAPPAEDLPVPGERYSFGQLELAQAMGDFEALETNGRWLLHVRLSGSGEKEVDAFCREVLEAVQAQAGYEKELKNY